MNKTEYISNLSSKDGIAFVGNAKLIADHRPDISSKRVLSGTISISGTSLTGTNTAFTSELSVDDIISKKDKPSKYHRITLINDDNSAEIDNLDGDELSDISGAVYNMDIDMREYKVNLSEVNDPAKISPDRVHHSIHQFGVLKEGQSQEIALINSKEGYKPFFNVNDNIHQAVTDYINSIMAGVLAYHIQGYKKDQKIAKIKVIEESGSDAVEKWYILYLSDEAICHKEIIG